MKDATGIPQHIRTAIAALAEVSPDLGGRLAAFAAVRTRRTPLHRAQRALLERGEPIEVAHGRERLRAWSWGQGPTVHLVHGWNGRAAQLGGFVSPLVAAGMRVVAHDSVGHGASSGGASSIVEMADALTRVGIPCVSPVLS